MEEALLMDVIVNPEVIPHNVTHAFLASAILIVVALIVKGSIQLVPRGIQNFMELIVDAIWKLVDENIGHHWSRQLFPFICTIFLFILVCNFMGLVPGFMQQPPMSTQMLQWPFRYFWQLIFTGSGSMAQAISSISSVLFVQLPLCRS